MFVDAGRAGVLTRLEALISSDPGSASYHIIHGDPTFVRVPSRPQLMVMAPFAVSMPML